MKRIALALLLSLALPALAPAQEPAPAVAEAPAAKPAPVVVPVVYGKAAEPASAPASLDNPGALLKLVFVSVKSGNWWAAAAALLVLVVSLLRTYGKKLHDWLPDNLIWDKPLWFIFDTKPGGWLLNVATAVAGGCGTALMAGEPVNWDLVRPILTVAVTGAALWEMGKDMVEWWKGRKAAVPDPAPTKP